MGRFVGLPRPTFGSVLDLGAGPFLPSIPTPSSYVAYTMSRGLSRHCKNASSSNKSADGLVASRKKWYLVACVWSQSPTVSSLRPRHIATRPAAASSVDDSDLAYLSIDRANEVLADVER